MSEKSELLARQFISITKPRPGTKFSTQELIRLEGGNGPPQGFRHATTFIPPGDEYCGVEEILPVVAGAWWHDYGPISSTGMYTIYVMGVDNIEDSVRVEII